MSGEPTRAAARLALGGVGAPAESRAGLQKQTLLHFVWLAGQHAVWTRRLVLIFGADELALASALAVLTLGGAVLLVSADRPRLMAANRVGATDFQVDTLSEALRILKNELRKGNAVGAGLHGGPREIAREMLNRGVQPEAVLSNPVLPDEAELARSFVALGAELLTSSVNLPDAVRIYADDAASAVARRDQDRALRAALSGTMRQRRESLLNLRWLSAAPRLFPRDRTRWLLTSDMAEDT